ncbi:hypothetical protein AQUCO_00100398v1 [Aquilegia coerulea]|uniref:Uncharacterized protein n=1 Tax=Aquilegia coerulea TaxID=218851 RepID=A0A2G5FA49_AQUCA|nr:hypothetical protein AQUCO_00100398v1 [Aquilegia coerulea]
MLLRTRPTLSIIILRTTLSRKVFAIVRGTESEKINNTLPKHPNFFYKPLEYPNSLSLKLKMKEKKKVSTSYFHSS